MSKYRDHVKRALWHSHECAEAIQRACTSLGVDPDEPLQSGLIPPSPEQDVSGPDFIEPTVFDDEVDGNPQGKRAAHLRLVRAFASYR